MNLFYLDKDPKKIAEYHNDTHLSKMILETAQMLCTAHHELPVDFVVKTWLYKPTHKNHPTSVWVRHSKENYFFAFEVLKALCKEYRYRKGKTHKTERLIHELVVCPAVVGSGFTQPPQAMPGEYKHEDTIQAYRNYYNGEKQGYYRGDKFIRYKWTKREIPYWFVSDFNIK